MLSFSKTFKINNQLICFLLDKKIHKVLRPVLMSSICAMFITSLGHTHQSINSLRSLSESVSGFHCFYGMHELGLDDSIVALYFHC